MGRLRDGFSDQLYDRKFAGPVGGQEWALWRILISMGLNAVQLPPAQIKAFALSMGKRAKTDKIDAELIARFLALRPDFGASQVASKV